MATPRPKNGFFGPKKIFENFFQKVCPKTWCLIPKPTFYHLWIRSYGHLKNIGTQKSPNFEMPITPPLGVREPKNFGFPSFSPGGTSMPKMIKIGEIRVLIYFDLTWNEPPGFFHQILQMRALSRHIFWKKIDFAFIFSFLGISDLKWPGKNIRHRF